MVNLENFIKDVVWLSDAPYLAWHAFITNAYGSYLPMTNSLYRVYADPEYLVDFMINLYSVEITRQRDLNNHLPIVVKRTCCYD